MVVTAGYANATPVPSFRPSKPTACAAMPDQKLERLDPFREEEAV
jgi:hypothetical protein